MTNGAFGAENSFSCSINKRANSLVQKNVLATMDSFPLHNSFTVGDFFKTPGVLQVRLNIRVIPALINCCTHTVICICSALPH